MPDEVEDRAAAAGPEPGREAKPERAVEGEPEPGAGRAAEPVHEAGPTLSAEPAVESEPVPQGEPALEGGSEREPTAGPGPEPEPEPAAATAAQPSRRTVVLLAALCAVLLAATAVLAVGYARARDDLGERRSAAAAADRARDRLRAELAAAVSRRDQLQQQLTAAEASALSPASRELIAKCVREYAEYERWLREIIGNAEARGGATGSREAVVWVQPDGSLVTPTTCTDAEPHLR
jgi:hypothetical protein